MTLACLWACAPPDFSGQTWSSGYSVYYTQVIQVQESPASFYIRKTRKSFLDLTLTGVFEITQASVLTTHLSLIKQRHSWLTLRPLICLAVCLSPVRLTCLRLAWLKREKTEGRSWLTPFPLTCLNVCLSPVCAQMDEIKLKDRAVSVLDKALGLQAGHAHRLQLQTQAAEQQIAALRDAQRAGLNHPTLNPNPNNAPHIVSSASSCLFKLHVKKPSHLLHVAEAPEHYSGSSCLCCDTDSWLMYCVTLSCVPCTSLHQCSQKEKQIQQLSADCSRDYLCRHVSLGLSLSSRLRFMIVTLVIQACCIHQIQYSQHHRPNRSSQRENNTYGAAGCC